MTKQKKKVIKHKQFVNFQWSGAECREAYGVRSRHSLKYAQFQIAGTGKTC